MRGSPKYAIVAIACCALLTSCSGNDSARGSAAPTPSPPTVTSTLEPTTPPTTTTDPRQSEPPELPPLARERSTAGAKAFIRHYIDAINYGFAANDTRPLVDIAGSGCSACQRLARTIRRISIEGGSQDGGEWKLRHTSFIPLQPSRRPIALVTVRVAAGFYKTSESDNRHRISRKLLTQEIRLAWDDGWRATELTTV